jgi:hypothetical protein
MGMREIKPVAQEMVSNEDDSERGAGGEKTFTLEGYGEMIETLSQLPPY